MRDYTQPGKREDRQARRRELSAQKHAVQEQLAELRGRLPGLSRSAMQPQKSSVSKKRPSDTKWEASRDGKRQRLEQERSRRVNGIWQQCQTILKGIMKSKDAFAFSKPVNPVAAKCPDYFDVIKHPMDLGTIQKKFPGKGRVGEKKPEAKEYTTPYQFRDDMRLVWDNCRTYNTVGHAVRTMGDTLSEAWEKKWALSGIEAKWSEEMHRQELEDKEISGGGDLAQEVQQLESALQQRLTASRATPEAEPNAMTFERKRRLSIALGQLSGDRVADVMRIISEDPYMREKAASTEEVEVDIDQLSLATLGTLERFVTGVQQLTKKKPGASKPQPAGTPAADQGANGAGGTMPDNAAAAPSLGSPSSNDSETDRSQSQSHAEVGSRHDDARSSDHPAQPGRADRPAPAGNDAATLVSTTRPASQPQIVKNMASKKVTNLQNEGAWADLGKELNEPDAADDGEENAEADNLWDEFKSREQEEEQREKEKQEEEKRQQEAKERAIQKAKQEAEAAKKEKEEAAAKRKEAETAAVKNQRDQELEEMKKASGNNDYAPGGVGTLDTKKQGETLNNVLGLQRKDSDSDEDSD